MENLEYDKCHVLHPTWSYTLTDEHFNEHSITKLCNVYKKDQIIFSEGKHPAGLYWINKGKVKISKKGREGREHIIRFAKDGGIIGYRALISGEKYTASAVALENSRICFIDSDAFFKLLKLDNELLLNIMRQLAVDLRIAELKLTEMAQKPLRERTAEVLLMFKDFYGVKNDGKTINVSLKREDIANIIGSATESLIRILSEFKQEKLIDLDAKEIKILNHKQLYHIANYSL